MNILLNIEKTEREIRELEIRSKSVSDQVLLIKREIVLLSLKERALLDNIENLKKTKAIVIALEYKRSKEDLNRTQSRLDMVRPDLTKLEKAVAEINVHVAKLAAVLTELKTQEVSNVLPFIAKIFK
jgi:chromosome segregation ATPase